jgi:drug/metabolite transporter (DMT)-like permease
MGAPKLRLKWYVLFYFACYVPYALLTKLLTSDVEPGLGRPLTGLEILPFGLVVSSIMVFAFLWLSGWWRVVLHRIVAGVPVFHIRPGLWLAGIGAAMLLVTVPMSYTFAHVSIPTVQLLMRGDVLLVAPVVDLMFGRRVRWYSWLALALVVLGLALTLRFKGGFDFPPLLVGIVTIYTLGYLIRIAVMTRIAKSSDSNVNKLYFVEERLVSIPLAIGTLALIATLGDSSQAHQLAWGFTRVWTCHAIPQLLVIALCLFLITIVAAAILLDRHENSYCVPLERSATILAGTAAAYVLAFAFGQHMPSSVELVGAILLIMAVTILAIGPKLGPRGSGVRGEEQAQR